MGVVDNTALYTEIVSGDATVPWVCKANELKFQSIHIYITSFVLNIVSETPFCHYKGPAVGTTNQIGFLRSVRVDLNVKRSKKIRATLSHFRFINYSFWGYDHSYCSLPKTLNSLLAQHSLVN